MSEATNRTLQQLTDKSRQKQQAFMQNIADRLGRPRVTAKPQHPFKGAPDFWRQFELNQEEKIALFSENWKNAGGHVVRLANMEAAKQFIADKAQSLQARLLVRQNQPELQAFNLEQALPETQIVVWKAEEKDTLLAHAAGADIGVTVVDYAAAYTGSIVVTSSGDTGRGVSLLPTVVMAIIPVERMKTRLGEVLANFDGRPREQFPAGIHFISGPSRSADIENDLTIGVHGPGIVFALIVG